MWDHAGDGHTVAGSGTSSLPAAGSPVTAPRAGSAPSPLRQLLGFFWPLALTSALMMVSHSIISSGLARTAAPALALAGYALALSLATIIEAPVVSVRQMTVALAADRSSYRAVAVVTYLTVALTLALGFLLTYSPLGALAFTRIFGAAPDVVAESRRAFQIVMLLPLAAGLRSLYHGLLVRSRRTVMLTVAMVLRLLAMAGIIYAALSWGWVTGGRVGAVALIVGMGIEALVTGLFSIRERCQLMAPPPGREADETAGVPGRPRRALERLAARLGTPDLPRTYGFFAPLMLAALLASTGKPAIHAGLARAPEGAQALAGLAVANAVAWIFIAPCQNLHQVTMVFSRRRGVRRRVPAFVLLVSALAGALLLGLAWTPAGSWLLGRVIGVEDELQGHALGALRVLALFPLVLGWLEHRTGVLLLHQQTRYISLARTANVAAIGLATAVGVLWGKMSSATAPAVQLLGFTVELAVMQVPMLALTHRLQWHRLVPARWR